MFAGEYYTVSLFGHRIIEDFDRTQQRLTETVGKLLREHEKVCFLVGRNGEFDVLAASVIRHAARGVEDDGCLIICVLPYATAEYRDNVAALEDYYDGVDIFDPLRRVHYKSVIYKRNCCMIDQSELVIFNVDRSSGGAYRALQYAKKTGKKIISNGMIQ